MEELVIQRVRPAGRPVLIDRHRGVVREVRVPEHFEHVVTADLRRTVKGHIESPPTPSNYIARILESIIRRAKLIAKNKSRLHLYIS